MRGIHPCAPLVFQALQADGVDADPKLHDTIVRIFLLEVDTLADLVVESAGRGRLAVGDLRGAARGVAIFGEELGCSERAFVALLGRLVPNPHGAFWIGVAARHFRRRRAARARLERRALRAMWFTASPA